MLKECKVLVNNPEVTVFDFDGTEVQVPSIGREAKKVKVLFEDGKFRVVADDFKEQETKPAKKTTVKESKEDEKEEK